MATPAYTAAVSEFPPQARTLSAVPGEIFPNLDPNLGRFGSFESIDDPLRELFPSHVNLLPEICLEWGSIP